MAALRSRLQFEFVADVMVTSPVRRLVVDYFATLTGDIDLAQRLGLAAHELLENAIKYSVGHERWIGLTVEQGSDADFTIRATNHASAEHRAELARLIGEMQQADSAEDFYRALVVRTAHRAGSGLGIARIGAEAEMALALSINGSEVTITAQSAPHHAPQTIPSTEGSRR